MREQEKRRLTEQARPPLLGLAWPSPPHPPSALPSSPSPSPSGLLTLSLGLASSSKQAEGSGAEDPITKADVSRRRVAELVSTKYFTSFPEATKRKLSDWYRP